jgi:acetoin utilization protein AcuB
MRAQEFMSEAVETVTPRTAAEKAFQQMRLKGIHHLVVTEGERLVGVISDRDVGGVRGASLRKGRTVADLMTPRVVTAAPTTSVRQAANLMRGHSIGCLVIAEGRRVLGIITVADLLTLLGRGLDRPVAATRRYTLKHRTPHVKRHRAVGSW